MIPFSYVRRKDNPLIILKSGYSDFTDTFDANVYEIDSGPLPNGYQMEIKKTPEELIAEARAVMLSQYKSAPIGLRNLFSASITEINGLLDLQDYELAVMKAEAVDLSVVEGSDRTAAEQFKDAFVQGLQALATLG